MKVSAGKILMLVENAYPQDGRVCNEACTLTARGYQVFVIAQRWKNQSFKEIIDQIHVFRLPQIDLFKKSSLSDRRFKILFYRLRSAVGYLVEFLYFTAASFLLSLYIHFRHGFQVIHIHNPPNILFLVGSFYRLFGKKFVFDHHDLSPELYLSRYQKRGGILYQYLLWEEKLCLRLADIIIATNQSYQTIDSVRGRRSAEDIFIVRNGPDLNKIPRVTPDPALRKMEKKILVYLGIMGPQDGVDYLLRSLAYLVHQIKRQDFYCMIIGAGDSLQDLKILAGQLKLEEFVRFTGYVPREDLLRYLSAADICLDPNPSSPLNDYSTWIKVMEYMAFAKPMVSFDLKETRYTAQEAALYVQPNDIVQYAKALQQLLDDEKLRRSMGETGRRRIVEDLAWEHVSRPLLRAYREIFSGNSNSHHQ